MLVGAFQQPVAVTTTEQQVGGQAEQAAGYNHSCHCACEQGATTTVVGPPGCRLDFAIYMPCAHAGRQARATCAVLMASAMGRRLHCWQLIDAKPIRAQACQPCGPRHYWGSDATCHLSGTQRRPAACCSADTRTTDRSQHAAHSNPWAALLAPQPMQHATIPAAKQSPLGSAAALGRTVCRLQAPHTLAKVEFRVES
jgi:hypothetical protein